MKKLAQVLMLAGVLIATVNQSMAATETANMTNQATISNSCTITTTGFTATYDPVSTNASTPLTTTVTVTPTCTSGASWTLTLGQGANADEGSTAAAPIRRLYSGADYLSYSIYSDSSYTTNWDNVTGVTGTGTGSAQAITGYARIPAGQNLPADAYTDTVVATVTF